MRFTKVVVSDCHIWSEGELSLRRKITEAPQVRMVAVNVYVIVYSATHHGEKPVVLKQSAMCLSWRENAGEYGLLKIKSRRSSLVL
jgi:hypothetical protein